MSDMPERIWARFDFGEPDKYMGGTWYSPAGIIEGDEYIRLDTHTAAVEAARREERERLMAVLSQAYGALRVPASGAFNDNGDLTVSHVLLSAEDVEQAYWTKRRVHAILSATPQQDAQDPWQPIETAPHGEDVLLFCPDRGCPTNRARIELGQASHGERGNGWSSMSFHSWATHWMPLPAPPATPQQEGEGT